MAISISYSTGKNDFDYGFQGHYMAIKEAIGIITFDSSYPTGGEPVATTDVHADCTEIIGVHVDESSSYFFKWDDTNKKILVYTQSTDAAAIAEVSNTTDLSAVTARIHLRCI